jgi:hypothetical protein
MRYHVNTNTSISKLPFLESRYPETGIYYGWYVKSQHECVVELHIVN